MYTLGIDSSTQSIKALVFDTEANKVVVTVNVNFGKELPEYGCKDGFLPNADPLIKESNPLMWLSGLDLVLSKLQKAFDTSKIAAVGGDGQQHGSVYLKSDWRKALAEVSAGSDRSLAEIFSGAFSRERSPIWMDGSTSAECREIEAAIGGARRMQELTGSPAIERFTGPQIRRFAKLSPEKWENTETVHLVSSFLASVMSGASAPIDIGDGAGMNLLDLNTLDWNTEICDATAPKLIERLPKVYRPNDKTPLSLASYFAKYGLKPGIPVVPFTGDNPASLVGTGADKPGIAVISLGTSDVFFAAMDRFQVDPDGYGHVFGNPSGGCMSLACIKNGSLAREKVREMVGCDYRFFDETAFELVPFNDLKAFPYFESEITPLHPATGLDANFNWDAASDAEKVVAVIRAQITNMFERTRWIGSFDVIRVTGGASRSRGIRDTIATIFNAKVETLDVPDSAALGGAILAARALA